MPLIVESLPPVQDLSETIGKKVIDEGIPISSLKMKQFTTSNGQIDFSLVVFKSQLPKNTLILKQDVDTLAVSGALKSGFRPLIVDENDIVVKRY